MNVLITLKLTDGMRNALANWPIGRVPFKDEQTHNQYLLLAKDDNFHLHDDYLRRELQAAFDQVDRGEVSDLDMDALLVEAHRRYAARLDEQEPDHH
jgi:hypothetical protein